jgi:hypothetical protein
MLSSVLFSETKKPPTTPSPKPVTPTCPSGKGCDSFKQLWLAKEKGVRGADWVCFQKTFSDSTKPSQDDHFLLLKVNYMLEFTSYENGLSGEYEVGLDLGAMESSKPPSNWKQVDGPFHAQRFGNNLSFVSTYQNPHKEQVQLDFAVNLATGRYSSIYTVGESDIVQENGQCIALSVLAKKVMAH